MRFSQTTASASTLLFSIVSANAILGFNSGSTLDTYALKHQADWEAEFKTAANLVGAPGTFNSVRLYTNIQGGTVDTPIEAFQAALNTNTTMLLGMWCSGTDNINNELSALKKAIQQYGQPFADLVVGISVGSEDLYRTSVSGIRNKAGLGQGPEIMVKFIEDTRKAIAETALAKAPVGHVDTWETWANSSNKAVVDAVDFLGNDLYPYYQDDKSDNSISNAGALFDFAQNATVAAAGGKPVWITETGWPASGPDWGKAQSTSENAKIYWDEIGCKLFGKTNTWWYNLRDSNPDNKAKFAITDNLSTTPKFNLTCPAVKTVPSPVAGQTSGGGSNSTTGGSTGSPSLTSGGSGGSSGSSGGSSGSAGGAGTSGGPSSSGSAPVSTGSAGAIGVEKFVLVAALAAAVGVFGFVL
ncbi:glycoside hydrolase [Tothia fuscella]|uniref:Glycoside hydrolase n=1 Tax=Tothia fuscella TaxID=1048955 RepID=A0A9P4NXG4_9PEZI|nr:glycoside hydrolase [Tothia fuscella]